MTMPQPPPLTKDASKSNGVLLDRYSRTFLLSLSGINLVLGLIFYAYPSFIISDWPWPVKELAVRFLGAIFLAIAFGCWSAVHAEKWQRAKILVLVGGTFFGLTGIVSLVRGITVSSDTSTWAWTGYFLIAGAGCFLLLQRYGWYRRQAETPTSTMPRGARLFFGIQTGAVGIFGIMMLLVPGLAQQEFWPWKVYVSTLQTFAALFLATCLATGWATRQKDPERIKVLLPLDAVFPSLALVAVAISWSVIAVESPSPLVTGVWVGLYSFVAAGSTILYFVLTRRSR
ncbi:hypothetical protein E6H12_11295 [Candidatus Bathyarchaeota archaeon]|nr:MAG: hypothetical protein E6H12_11295 [Candidatus Bathyarchaeota archaeon]